MIVAYTGLLHQLLCRQSIPHPVLTRHTEISPLYRQLVEVAVQQAAIV